MLPRIWKQKREEENMMRNISIILRIVIVIAKAFVNNGNATIFDLPFLLPPRWLLKTPLGTLLSAKKCSPYVEISE